MSPEGGGGGRGRRQQLSQPLDRYPEADGAKAGHRRGRARRYHMSYDDEWRS